jgi:hypothetical protein
MEKKTKEQVVKVKGLDKILLNRLKNKKIVKDSRAVIDVSQPVVLNDKSRFFKEEWDEDRRQLFFT